MNNFPKEPTIDHQSPWNMAQFFYFSLNKLIEQKDEAYVNGDIYAHYRGLRAILSRCIHKLHKEEADHIKSLLDDIYEQFSSLFNLPKNYNQAGAQILKPKIEKALYEADHQLSIYMHNHEIIEPRFQKKGVDNYEKRTGV